MCYLTSGNVLAANYLRVPSLPSQSLQLTGRYLYTQVRTIPDRYFIIHLYVVRQDDSVLDISITNLFKSSKLVNSDCLNARNLYFLHSNQILLSLHSNQTMHLRMALHFYATVSLFGTTKSADSATGRKRAAVSMRAAAEVDNSVH